jgi:hypothetical protein
MGPVSIGASGGIGKTTTSADSFSTSAGSRNLSASMSQQVADATHQAASSVRNRRATIVKEISETEHESVSTRILANYNHMHALTVQYFEVIELYRVATGLHEAERCLFVPMKLVDFDERVITRFQGALAAAALNRRAFELLITDFGMIRLSATRPMRPLISTLGIVSTAVLAGRERLATLARSAGETPEAPEEPATPAPEPTPPRPAPAAAAVPLETTWIAEEIRRASRITASPLIRCATAARRAARRDQHRTRRRRTADHQRHDQETVRSSRRGAHAHLDRLAGSGNNSARRAARDRHRHGRG